MIPLGKTESCNLCISPGIAFVQWYLSAITSVKVGYAPGLPAELCHYRQLDHRKMQMDLDASASQTWALQKEI